jgi:hypothetical protein
MPLKYVYPIFVTIPNSKISLQRNLHSVSLPILCMNDIYLENCSHAEKDFFYQDMVFRFSLHADVIRVCEWCKKKSFP